VLFIDGKRKNDPRPGETILLQALERPQHHRHAPFDIAGATAENPTVTYLASERGNGHPFDGDGVLVDFKEDGACGWSGGFVDGDQVFAKGGNRLANRTETLLPEPRLQKIGQSMFEEEVGGSFGPAHRIDAGNLNELGQKRGEFVGSWVTAHTADLLGTDQWRDFRIVVDRPRDRESWGKSVDRKKPCQAFVLGQKETNDTMKVPFSMMKSSGWSEGGVSPGIFVVTKADPKGHKILPAFKPKHF
jgi:hypothetical protein